jgi:uncharacterized protein (DUF305 family)
MIGTTSPKAWPPHPREATTHPKLCRSWILLIAVLVGLLGGCADEPTVASEATFNDTDVMFLQMAVDLHRQGADVVALAADRGRRPELRRLAARMKQEWADESRAMTAWLRAWDAPTEASRDEGVHAGHGDLHSLRPADVAELRAASGADFDRVALSLLLGHHHRTVELARMEAQKGGDRDVKRLAEQMTTTRQAQIRQMLTLLAG